MGQVRVNVTPTGWHCCLHDDDDGTVTEEIFIPNGTVVSFPAHWNVPMNVPLTFVNSTTLILNPGLAGTGPATPRAVRESVPLVGDIYALRGWGISGGLLDGSRQTLTAVGVPYVWEPGPQLARCYHNKFDRVCRHGKDGALAPCVNCQCGFWTQTDVDGMTDVWRRYGAPHMDMPVVGVVRVWGRCFETQFGIRAEWAEPVFLGVVERDADALAERYGVPAQRLTRARPISETMAWMTENGMELGIREDAA